MRNHVAAASLVMAAAGLVLATQASKAGSALGTAIVDTATQHPLTLINGWTNSPYSTNAASVELLNGVVRFRGAIATSGSDATLFVLPKSFRPAADVYVPVDLCNAANGRLYISTDGTVTVQAQNNFSDAQCFTSLDGASFVKTASGYKALTLLNGWTESPYSTYNAAVHSANGIVQFEGAIATSGSSAEAFILPKAFRPATTVYVPVDLCNANKGRLYIQQTGEVDVQAESDFSDAQCFTSLDGASFSLSASKLLTLQNGWTVAPFSTSSPAVVNVGGVVHLRGAMATSGTTATAFTLPAAFRPSADTYVPIDLCNATNGRLYIQPSGAVTVQAETDFSNAQCFTSLDGASFVE